jgi:hypothetical protein
MLRLLELVKGHEHNLTQFNVIRYNWFWYNVVFSDIAASNLVPVKSSSLLRGFTTSCLWSIAIQFLARIRQIDIRHVY